MRIALIHPSFGVVSVVNQPSIKAVADNYGVYPNLSLGYVAGALQEEGHEVLFLDSMASNLSLNDVVEKLNEFKPEVMMFSLTTYLIHETHEIIRFLKAKFNVPVIVGGHHVGLYPKETINKEGIDIGIIGEAEKTVVELISALENKKSLSEIEGIVYMRNNKLNITKTRKKIKNLDEIPFPARNLMPMEIYYSFISKKKNYTIMMTSRGCPFQCSFCEQRTGDIRYRSPKNVVDEIEECVNKYDVKEIDFFDPLFTINKKRVLGICKEIQKRKIDFIWSCRSRVDTIDGEMLKEMKKAGCYRIYYGLESGSEKILKNIRKNTKIRQIKTAIKLTKKNGILAFGYFMFGCPGETEKTIKKTIRLAKELPLDYAQFNRYSYMPGSTDYDELKKQIGFDYWKRYVEDIQEEMELPRIDCELSDEQLNKYIRKAYLQFYLRPKVIVNSLKNTRSLGELMRYGKALKSMIFN